MDQMKERIVELRTGGLAAVSVNTYLRHVKSYYLWQGKEFTLKPLKEEQKLLATLSPEQIGRIVSGKPAGRNETRVRMIALTALDTGMRIQEVLNLRRTDVDFDNLVFRVHGKGPDVRFLTVNRRKGSLRRATFSYHGGQTPPRLPVRRSFRILYLWPPASYI